MSLEKILQEIGFSSAEALYLSQHDYFHHQRKTQQQLENIFQEIATIYHCAGETVKKAVLKHPPFAGLDHQRVVEQATAIYGNEDAVKKAVLKHPPFAGLDHQRVVEQAAAIYGHEDAVKKAVLKFPQFAGYDHQRVLRQKGRLGRMAGFEKETVIEKILQNPVYASYSARRYLAAFDVARELEQEGFTQNEIMLQAFLSNYGKSPYVPNTNRKRISQVEDGEEPPLLKVMRKYLTNYYERR